MTPALGLASRPSRSRRAARSSSQIASHDDRELRGRRLFIEERAASLHFQRDQEFRIKTDVSAFFSIPYSSICFCGSAQLGFSVHKDKFFEPLFLT